MLSRSVGVVAGTVCTLLIWSLTAAAYAADGPPPTLSQSSPQVPSNQSLPRSPLKSSVHWPGPQPDGNTLLFNQWSLRPGGRQVPLGFFPVNVAIHPSGAWAAVLHCGYRRPEIVVVDLKHQEVASRVAVPQAFYGITFDPAGKRLFASGAEFEVVHQYAFADGKLSDHHELRIANPKSKQIPAGLACSPDGKTLWVACTWGSTLARVPLDRPAHVDRLQFALDSYPYAVAPSHDGRRLYVSLWGKSAVAVVDARAWKIAATWPTGNMVWPIVYGKAETAGSHPTEMAVSPDDESLYVACANLNAVMVLDTRSGELQEQISTSLYPNAPNGSTPSSLALSADGKVLLVANSDNNNLAVFDVSQRGKSRSLGFIPTGWYPTSVRFGPAKSSAGNSSANSNPISKNAAEVGQKIFVVSGKGLNSRPNPNGPVPTKLRTHAERLAEQYVGQLFPGSLATIEPPSPSDMARYSQQAWACSPLKAEQTRTAKAAGTRPPAADSPVPAKVGLPSPIRHVVYIIRENRTYDQVMGDISEGNGDPRLCLFGRHVTPNAHALAKQFVLLDNFYANAEVSAQGHEWSTAAYCSDFVEKTWPLHYRGEALGKIEYPGEGRHPMAFPAVGYIWDRCQQSGVSYRDYGEFIENGLHPGDPGHTKLKALEGHFDPQFRAFDLGYPDAKRTDFFLQELDEFNKSGNMPQFIMLHLPDDHTHGVVIGRPTPTAMIAENDLALGRLVEAVSHSRFWPDTAIFIVEDDAQNGSDHVDAHRTVALVISPFCRHGVVDSTLYSTTSMLRTMELILGLQPMSQFDAAATPMYGCFQSKPNLEPCEHVAAEVRLTDINAPWAWGAEASAKLDFSREDAADEQTLNQEIWHSVRGPDVPMPPPVHAAFVRTHPATSGGDDDD